MTQPQTVDCAIIGSGIVGLAHALAAHRAGRSVLVIDRDATPAGASIRNFGFVTITGQQRGTTWRRARRSRDIWAEIAPLAGIDIIHTGLTMVARRPEAMACLEQFAAGPMGEACRLLRPADLPPMCQSGLAGGLHSPHELRVESRTAIPRLATWLEHEGVAFRRGTAALHVEPGRIDTSAGPVHAETIIVCPGTDLVTLFPDIIARHHVRLCKLHMMRMAAPAWRLPTAIMSDLGLVRYLGYEDCPGLPALHARLQREQPDHLANGVHLIAVQGADGTLVVGDSHHTVAAADPFQPESVDALIIDELCAVLQIPHKRPIERWVGFYPTSPEIAFIEAPAPGIRLALVTSGTGASTAFALAEDTFASLHDQPALQHAG